MPALLPYQREGVEWLSDRRYALLADEMGLGKTAQAISAADNILASRLLVICPSIGVENFRAEHKKFSFVDRPLRVVKHRKQQPLDQRESVIASFELAVALHQQGWFAGHTFDVLIVDEAHFVKNAEAKRTMEIFGSTGIARQCLRVWALSGTPMPNHPGELWIWLRMFGRTTASYDTFCETFCDFMKGPRRWRGPRPIVGAKQSQTGYLRELLEPIMLRRLKSEVATEIPPITYGDVTVDRGPIDLSLTRSFIGYFHPYDRSADLMSMLEQQEKQLEQAMAMVHAGGLADVSATKTMQSTVTLLEALAQSVSSLRRYVGLLKAPGVAQMVNFELTHKLYKKVVIFCVHRDVVEYLQRMLVEWKPVSIYGQTLPNVRAAYVKRFQEDPDCRVFIGNIRAAGTSITLTAARDVILAEQDWVPANNAQAIMRVHRLGQTQNVCARFVGLVDSIDAKISTVLRRKTRDAVAILDSRVSSTESNPFDD